MFELSVSRLIDALPETVYKIWTERTEEFFCPKPYQVKILENDFRPGGRSAMVMTGPDGFHEEMEGVYLEVIPNRLIVSTDGFKKGWEPQGPFMVAITRFEEENGKTRYTATARHWTEEAYEQHKAMGFEGGWGIVADQLAELAEAEG